jgi:hypothetical protein
MTYDKSTLTVEPTSRDRVLTPAFLLVAAATLFAFLSIGVVLPVLPRYTEGSLGTGSVGVGLAVGAASLTALLAQPPAGRLGDLRGRRPLMIGGGALMVVGAAGLVAAEAAIDYQRLIQPALERHFADVRLEWSVVKGATDAFARDINRYGPRVDIAVGPFNTTRGPIHRSGTHRFQNAYESCSRASRRIGTHGACSPSKLSAGPRSTSSATSSMQGPSGSTGSSWEARK